MGEIWLNAYAIYLLKIYREVQLQTAVEGYRVI